MKANVTVIINRINFGWNGLDNGTFSLPCPFTMNSLGHLYHIIIEFLHRRNPFIRCLIGAGTPI